MYKVAILGTENSHAWAFTKMIFEGLVSDLELIGAYGYDEEANKKMLELGTPYIAKTPEEFLGKVDGIIVTARHGTLHKEYALPYVRKGIPAFIDKPFTVTEADAVELAQTAKNAGALLCGGSCFAFEENILALRDLVSNPEETLGTVRGASFFAPVELKSIYGGFFFYSQHLIQMMTTVFGNQVTSVLATAGEDRVSAICRYPEFDVAAIYYEKCPQYSAAVYGAKGVEFRACGKNLDPAFLMELQEFRDMLKTRHMPNSYRDLIAPVFILNALWRSVETGTMQPVKIPEIE